MKPSCVICGSSAKGHRVRPLGMSTLHWARTSGIRRSGQAGISPGRGRTCGRRPLAATRQRGKVSCRTVICNRTRLTSNCSCRQIACAKSIRDTPLISRPPSGRKGRSGSRRGRSRRGNLSPCHGTGLLFVLETKSGRQIWASSQVAAHWPGSGSLEKAGIFLSKHRTCTVTPHWLLQGHFHQGYVSAEKDDVKKPYAAAYVQFLYEHTSETLVTELICKGYNEATNKFRTAREERDELEFYATIDQTNPLRAPPEAGMGSQSQTSSHSHP